MNEEGSKCMHAWESSCNDPLDPIRVHISSSQSSNGGKEVTDSIPVRSLHYPFSFFTAADKGSLKDRWNFDLLIGPLFSQSTAL